MAIMTPSRSRNQSNSKRLSDLFNENWRWTILFSVPFAVSLSLFVFVRFLNFYLTPTVNKGIVFAALFIFFYFFPDASGEWVGEAAKGYGYCAGGKSGPDSTAPFCAAGAEIYHQNRSFPTGRRGV
jgi:hypothetical protein